MANKMFISTENIKSMVKQFTDNTPKMVLATYKPKNNESTLVLVSELSEAHGSKGFSLYWANKDTFNDDEVTKLQKALEELGLPF